MEAVDDDLVRRSQALHSLGAYDSAVNILRKAVEKSQADLQISFELCETLMHQGYYGDALQAAVEALGTEFASDNEFLIPMRLLRCLTDAVVTARVKTNVQEATREYSALGDQGEFTTHVQVCVLAIAIINVYWKLRPSSGPSHNLLLPNSNTRI